MVLRIVLIISVKVIYSILLEHPNLIFVCLAFHSRLNRRIERAHSNIWSFITCLVAEECRFQHLYSQVNAGTSLPHKTTPADSMQKRLDTLNDRYNNHEINGEQLLNALSLLIALKK